MSRFVCALTALVAAVLLVARVESRSLQAPVQRPATGLIFGRVVEAGTNTPVRGAMVRLFGTQEDGPRFPAVMTDNEGHFVFGAMPAGSYRLFAVKFGYADAAFGQRRPNLGEDPTPLVLADGERRSGVTIRLWKHAAITGTIVDEFGEPAIGVSVRAFPRTFIAGRPKLGANGAGYARTDDRGIYRFSRLVAGEYVVAIVRSERTTPMELATRFDQIDRGGNRDAMMAMYVDLERAGLGMPRFGDSGSVRIGSALYGLEPPPAGVRNGRLFTYPSQFYGGGSQIAGTRAIALQPGQEVSGIDFAMKPGPAYRVSGQVTDASGPVENLPIQLTRAGGGDFEFDRMKPASRTLTDANGRFTLLGVTPGDHVLRAFKGPVEGAFGIVEAFGAVGDGGAVISTPREVFTSPAAAPKTPTIFATTSVGVTDHDLDDLALVVRGGVRLGGQIEFADSASRLPAAQLKRLRVMVEPREGLRIGWEFDWTGEVAQDGKFETAELPPGFYLMRMLNLPDGWALESAMTGGRDMTDVAIEITDKPLAPVTVRLNNRPSAISGVVRPAASTEQVDEAIVLAFPVDRARWVDYGVTPRRLREAQVARTGDYTLSGLPPGEYFVTAIRDDSLFDWHDPAFLEKLVALATRVTLAAGERKAQSLTMGRVK